MQLRKTLSICFALCLGSIGLLAQPVVDLGSDTLVCGSIILDAGNTGANYAWNTSETTQTITASTTGIYWVDVTDGSGTTRDSIFVEILQVPSVNPADTNICGPQQIVLSPTNDGETLFWYDSLNSTSPFAITSSLSTFISDSQTVYVEAVNEGAKDSIGLLDENSIAGAGKSFIKSDRGLRFNSSSTGVLKSVEVLSNGTTTFTVQLETSSGTILHALTVTVPSGVSTVDLNFDLPIGNDLLLMARNFSSTGAGLRWLFSAPTSPYPLSNDYISITNTADNLPDRYYIFFNWTVTRGRCTSARIPLNINVLPSPALELGPDIAACGGGVTLDATSPGASYSWNTGDTTATLNVIQTGTYAIASTLLSCTLEDTVFVELIPNPDLAPLDTGVCGPQDVVISPPFDGQTLFWYDSLNATRPLSVGGTYTVFVADSVTLYAEAVNEGINDSVGLSDVDTFSNKSFIKNSRGMKFDVLTDCRLRSVTLISQSATDLRVDLLDDQGILLDSVSVSLPSSGRHEVLLNFDLPVGTDFELFANNIVTSGQGLRWIFNESVPYPFVLDDLVQITNTADEISNRYYIFFDWVINRGICVSNRVPINVEILPAPILDLGVDRAICGDSTLLDATSTGATYLWSTGESSGAISVDQTGTYSVASTLATCTLEDSVFIELIDQPEDPVVAAIDLCGPQTTDISASTAGDLFLWYDSLSSIRPFEVTDTLRRFFSDSSTLYVEALNLGDTSITGLPDLSQFSNQSFIKSDRGMSFDVFNDCILQSVFLITDSDGAITIQLETSTGAILDTVRVAVPGAGKHEVQLNFSLSPGTDYRLMARNMQASGSGFQWTFGSAVPYPFVAEDLVQINTTADNLSDRYYIFFDWVITRGICISGRQPFQVNVLPAPILDLGFDRGECGSSYVIDAQSAGASYVWNTGDTTGTVTITQSGVYTVASTLGTCTLVDSVDIELVPFPQDPIISDTLICGNADIVLEASHGGNFMRWYEDLMTDEYLTLSDTFATFIDDTITYYVEAASFNTPAIIGETIINPNQIVNVQGNERGIIFDAESPLILKSLTLHSLVPSTGTILLTDANGVVLDSVIATSNGPQGQEVFLFFDVPAGTGYRLIGKDISGSGWAFFSSNTFSYPYTASGKARIVSSLQGTFDRYDYFFDLSFVQALCLSDRKPVTVTPALPLELGPETLFSCDPILLDAGNPTASFVWSTGDTVQSITVTETGVYSVLISDGTGCESTDTIEVTIPGIDLGDDGVLCGDVLFSGYDTSSTFLWSTGALTPDITLTATGTYFVTLTEPGGCVLTDTIRVDSFVDFPVIDLGMDFSTCEQAVLDGGDPDLSYAWNTGDTTQTLLVQASGLYAVTGTNVFGCATSDTVSVNVVPFPTADFTFQTNDLNVSFQNFSSFGSYEWDFGDGNGSTAISPQYTYQDSGTYTVQLIVTDFLNNCGSDTLEVTVIVSLPVGIDISLKPQVSIFPNPSSGAFFLELENASVGETQLEIWNLQGQRVYESSFWLTQGDYKTEVIRSDLAEGVYILRIHLSNGQGVQTLWIKE
ncbi:MAG: PKD domain-containing protein [Bacteroidota bacterium]